MYMQFLVRIYVVVQSGCHCYGTESVTAPICSGRNLVLLRFSKSGKRTVSDGFVKKSADSDSVSDSRRRRYKLIYTGRRRAPRLSTGRGKCGDDAPRRRSFLAGKSQSNHMPTWHVLDTPYTYARTRTSDTPPATMQAATHRRTTLHNTKTTTTCHPP